MNRNTYFIAGAALLVGVLVVYFAVSGFPPTEEVAGTMAGDDSTIAGVEQAERYRADAISEEDVELDDQTINDLLQDPDVVAVLQDEDFRNALTEGALTEALTEARFEHLITSGMLREAMTKYPALRTAMLENNLAEFLATNERIQSYEGFNRLHEALTNERIEFVMRSNALVNFLTKAPERGLDLALEEALADPNFRALFQSRQAWDNLTANKSFMNQLMEARPTRQ